MISITISGFGFKDIPIEYSENLEGDIWEITILTDWGSPEKIVIKTTGDSGMNIIKQQLED